MSPRETNRRPAKILLITILGAATLISIALSIYLDIESRFLGSESRQGRSQLYHTMDPLVLTAANDKGLLIHYDHQQTSPAQWGHVPQIIYFRSVYLLYPQPVLINDPSIPIDDLPDVMNSNFDPTNAWLLSQSIGSIITFEKSTGAVRATYRPIAPTTQP